MKFAQMTNRMQPDGRAREGEVDVVSRTKERWVDAGVRKFSLGKLQRQHREDDPDDALPDQLPPCAEPEAALPGDLDVVVEEADEPEPGHQEQHEDG